MKFEDHSKSLILLRGLPGSGKSTLSNLLSEKGKYPVYSVDDFFTDAATGKYHFEFDKNHLAYKQCEANTKRDMESGIEKIFVANTFTLDWEIEPYFRMAVENNYSIFIATVEKHHNGSNIHEIPDDQIKKMAEKYRVKLY